MQYNNIRLKSKDARTVIEKSIIPTEPKRSFEEVFQDFAGRVTDDGKSLETVSFFKNLNEFNEFFNSEMNNGARIRVLRRFCYDDQTPLILYNMPGEQISRSIGIWGCEINTSIIPPEYQAIFL